MIQPDITSGNYDAWRQYGAPAHDASLYDFSVPASDAAQTPSSGSSSDMASGIPQSSSSPAVNWWGSAADWKGVDLGGAFSRAFQGAQANYDRAYNRDTEATRAWSQYAGNVSQWWSGFPALIKSLFDPARISGPFVASQQEVAAAYQNLTRTQQAAFDQALRGTQAAYGAARPTALDPRAFQIQQQSLFPPAGTAAKKGSKLPIVIGVALLAGLVVARQRGWIGKKKAKP